MPMHALIVNEHTLDFITQVNGGVRPAPVCLENKTFFVHGDRIDDPPNELMTPERFHATYQFVDDEDDNSNIVELR
jgi:hypothetical protein